MNEDESFIKGMKPEPLRQSMTTQVGVSASDSDQRINILNHLHGVVDQTAEIFIPPCF